ncbi:MAG: PorP/SprF family type IX secretion system membrane protein [Chitinophagales bacterium]
MKSIWRHSVKHDSGKRGQHQYRGYLAILFICLLGIRHALAQDVHFTQFFTNPLALSPASTGYFDGDYRIGFNYKYQWPWATQQTFNYHTQAAYADFSVLERKTKMGWLGLGLNFLNDQAGDGRLRYMRFGGSVAWHQPFDKAHRFILSLGYGFHYVQKSIDFEPFYFNNQWVADVGFDRSLPDFERPSSATFSQFDMGAGLNFHAKVSDRLLLGTTFSMLHLNRPKDAFYTGNNQLGFRYVASAKAEIQWSRGVSILTNAYFTYQKKAYEVVFGAMGAFRVHEESRRESAHTLYAGAYYRVKDALSPIVGYQFKGTRLLVNYDIIFSRLSTPGRFNGGLEFSLVHIGRFPMRHTDKKVACPKF